MQPRSAWQVVLMSTAAPFWAQVHWFGKVISCQDASSLGSMSGDSYSSGLCCKVKRTATFRLCAALQASEVSAYRISSTVLLSAWLGKCQAICRKMSCRRSRRDGILGLVVHLLHLPVSSSASIYGFECMHASSGKCMSRMTQRCGLSDSCCGGTLRKESRHT